MKNIISQKRFITPNYLKIKGQHVKLKKKKVNLKNEPLSDFLRSSWPATTYKVKKFLTFCIEITEKREQHKI